MLGSADLLVALLEPDAARFSVPSKVLSYLSVGRTVVALVPEGNPAAQDVPAAGGCAADPTADGVRVAADWISAVTRNPAELTARAARARNLAERRFDISVIGARFESIFEAALADTRPVSRVRSVSTFAAESGSVA